MRRFKASAADGAEASTGKDIILANHQRNQRGWYLCGGTTHKEYYKSFMCSRK